MVVHYPRGVLVVAVFLSGLAGFVDAMGFIMLGGFFVSFMSGNSTKLSVSAADGLVTTALTGAGIVALFVVGVMIGSVTGRRFGIRHRSAVLTLVTMLLILAATAHLAGWTPVAISLMITAMGAENTTFEREGEVSISLTYMTGSLVKMGQRLVTAFSGGDRWGWVRHFLLWAAMVVGAFLGATAHRLVGLEALWFAALWGGILAVVIARRPPVPTAAE
ncbi:YoaK family protein [Rhodococcus sp. TAF43]|uniref:YoaK family protein n=1 Tax=Rhodococcus sp. TAF43 TaxID=3237483 RepID=UPI003F94B052